MIATFAVARRQGRQNSAYGFLKSSADTKKAEGDFLLPFYIYIMR
jgi:hypothetical protein